MRRGFGKMTQFKLGATMESLRDWALGHSNNDVSDDAALQLARRDKLSVSFLSFVERWVPAGHMTPERFERFAHAWETVQREKMVAHLGSEVPIPDDLKEPAPEQ